jgi:selenocysteine-specific elongation factor
MSSDGSHFSPQTRFFTISTAGHVDHGKTSLIKALTGIDPDRLKEEQERQMTIDLGFAHLLLPGDMVLGFVDVPGHGKFLKNMLAGVGGIDMALLVVAADEGPMPQTIQHVRILSLLGVRKAIVAITKTDLVAEQDRAAQISLVQQEIEELLRKHDIKLLCACPISSTKHSGFDELKKAFMTELEKLPKRDTAGGASLPIDRVFSKSGFGKIVTGTLVKGRIAVGDQVTVEPGDVAARVRRLETFGHEVESAGAGQRVACNIVLKEDHHLSRGQVVLTQAVPVSKQLMVSIIDKPKISGENFAADAGGQPIRLYHGTAECHGVLRWVDDVSTSPDAVEAIGMVALTDPVVAHAADRYVIRMSDDSIYGGEILICDRPRWMRRNALIELSQLLIAEDYKAALLSFVESAPHQIVRQSLSATFLPGPAAGDASESLIAEKKIARLDTHIMTAESRKRLADSLVAEVKSQSSSEEGAPLESVRGRLVPKLDRATFQKLIEEESSSGKVVRAGDRLRLPGTSAPKPADPVVDQLQKKILGALNDAFCLDLDELARTCGSDASKTKAAVTALAKGGQVHLINYEFAISDGNLKKAHEVLASIWNQKRNIAPTDFRESLNTTRKYAMALLQHFDDNKITRRLESGRVLLKGPAH